METKVIICGDNLEALHKHVSEGSVDLIYIDPPFNSNRKYEVFWGEAAERRSFEDRHKSIEAYLDYMEPRVRQLYRCLKRTGSFYYHADWHAGHYIKVMLDGIFGPEQFQNEIVWYRSYAHNDPKRYGASHDTIFFYTKSQQYTWHPQYMPYRPGHASSFRHADPDGRIYQTVTLTAGKPGGDTSYAWKGIRPPRGRYWAYSKENLQRMEDAGLIVYSRNGVPRLKKYLDEAKGVPLQTVWTDIPPLGAHDKERMGFPTQKPVVLLERLLKASSNPGDVVLDAFCGCGTTLEAAARLGREWIGIDSSPTACRVMSARLEKRLGLRQAVDFQLREMPKTTEDLRRMPPFEFENWAVLALEGTPNRIKTGDFGIDGRIYPARLEKQKVKSPLPTLFDAEQMQMWFPIQVKQKDKVGRPDIDAFETAMRRDRRVKGYFVAFDFTGGAIREIERAEREDGLQVVPLTVNDLLEFERTAA